MITGLIPTLNEAHSSRIAITLTLSDEALVKFAEWAQGREIRSILYLETNTLKPAERAGLLADIACMRGIMQELRDDLQLGASPKDIAKTIQAHCYILWVDVLEMTCQYLRGFGPPPREMVDYLDPKVHLILKYLDHIKALLANSDASG
jgi:hypothetical protein